MTELTDERLAELRTIAANVGAEFDYGRVDDDNTETVAEWMASCSKDPGAPAAGRLWAVYAPEDEREGLIISAIAGDGENAQYFAEHIAAFDPPTVLALLAEVERLREGRDELQRRLDAVEARHTPVTVRYGDAPDELACRACGTHYEYPVAWPCPTVKAVRGEA